MVNEQEARDKMFSEKLNAPQTTTISLTRAQAEIVAQALLEFVDKRSNYPVDARRYYHAQLAAVRAQMPSAFPVTYNED